MLCNFDIILSKTIDDEEVNYGASIALSDSSEIVLKGLNTGDVWKKYWPTIDNETIEKLVSGEYYFHKMYRSEDSYFYAASKSKVINSDIEYLIVLPVITSVE